MKSPRVISASLLDCFAVSIDRFGILAAPSERQAERVVRIGIIGLLFDRRSKRFDCAAYVACVQKRARKLVISSREIPAAHLNSHAIAIDRFVEPSLVIEDDTFIQVLLCCVERTAHEKSP